MAPSAWLAFSPANFRAPLTSLPRLSRPVCRYPRAASMSPAALRCARTFKAEIDCTTAQPGLCESLLGEHNDRCERTNHHDNGSQKESRAAYIRSLKAFGRSARRFSHANDTLVTDLHKTSHTAPSFIPKYPAPGITPSAPKVPHWSADVAELSYSSPASRIIKR